MHVIFIALTNAKQCCGLGLAGANGGTGHVGMSRQQHRRRRRLAGADGEITTSAGVSPVPLAARSRNAS